MSVSRARVERAATAAAGAEPSVEARRSQVGDGPVVPNIADFVLGSEYLGIERIYPRQLLVAKLVMAQPGLLTDFDHGVLAEWTAGFTRSEDGTGFEGGYGTTPDVLDRIARLAQLSRPYFREVVMVLGRRASKNWLGAILGAYVVWRMLCTGDPQAHFRIDANKTLTVPVFAGQADQARSGQWRDLVERITSAPCYERYVADQTSSTLRLWTPRQLRDGAPASGDRGLIAIVAREATSLAARGPAAAAIFMDEMAHMTNAGANRDAQEIFAAAEPSLRQCQPWEFIYESSSPASQQGRFYENYRRGLELDEHGNATHPETLVLQLTSWDLYRDWERTVDGLEAYPGGPFLPVLEKPLVAYDDTIRDQDKHNPETSLVENWAQWRSSPDAYLARDQVIAIFEPFEDRRLVRQERGTGAWRYVAHVDPSKSQANTALVIAHLEPVAGEQHMFVDHSRLWRPADFTDGIVDPRVIVEELKVLLRAFRIAVLSFDQFNSIGSIVELRDFVADAKLPVRTRVDEVTATAPGNWRMAEQFKTMVGQGRVHAPHDPHARDELIALVEKNGKVSHPTAGLVRTDDAADSYINVLDRLIGPDYGHLLSGSHLRASQQRSPFGSNPYQAELGHNGRRTFGTRRGAAGGRERGRRT